MKIIFESEKTKVRVPNHPHITRKEGGHIVISPIKKVENRSDLDPKTNIELARIIEITGIAMKEVLNNSGIQLERINYQDNGNWAYLRGETPEFHYHLYGRARGADTQKFGHACVFPYIGENPEFYKNIEPLSETDCLHIKEKIEDLLKNNEKYSDSNWGL